MGSGSVCAKGADEADSGLSPDRLRYLFLSCCFCGGGKCNVTVMVYEMTCVRMSKGNCEGGSKCKGEPKCECKCGSN